MLTPEERLTKASGCEELSGQICTIDGQELVEAAAIWRPYRPMNLGPEPFQRPHDLLVIGERRRGLMSEKAKSLRQRAEHYRRVTTSVTDDRARQAAIELAQELEDRAVAIADLTNDPSVNE